MKSTEPRLRPDPGTRVANGLLAIFLIGLVLCGAISLTNTLRLLPYQGETLETDCIVGYLGYRVYRGGPVYTRADEPPYTPTEYGPLSYLSPAAVGWFARPASFQAFVVDGRLLVFGFFLLIPLVAYVWARRWGLPSVVTLAAPLFVFADPTFFRFNAGQRPDIPALLFALLGFSLLSTPHEPGEKRVAAAGLLMGIAFLFKQTFLAAPAAAFFWLLVKRRYRSAALLTASALAPVVVTVAWLELRGEPVLYSLLLLRHIPCDVPRELQLTGVMVIASPTVLLQVALGLAGLGALRRRWPGVARLAGLYLALATVTSLVTMAAVGSPRWHLMEPMTICSLLAPLGLNRWVQRLRTAPFETRLGAALIFAGLPAISIAGSAGVITARHPSWAKLCSAIAGHRVFSDNAYVAAQAKDPEMINPFIMVVLERGGQWSPAPVVRQIQEEQFDYIILKTDPNAHGQPILRRTFWPIPFYSPSILKETERNYRMAGLCVDGGAVVFVPRQEPRGTELARRLAAVCGWYSPASTQGVPPGPRAEGPKEDGSAP